MKPFGIQWWTLLIIVGAALVRSFVALTHGEPEVALGCVLFCG